MKVRISNLRLIDKEREIYQKLDATKLVSKANISRDEMKSLLVHIDTINALREDDLPLAPYAMANYRVPAELAPLFWPEAVMYDVADRRSVNLLKRDEPESVEPNGLLKYDEFLVLADKLFSCYKKPVTEFVTLEEIRKRMNLRDALPFMSVAGKVHDESGLGWIPYPMVDGIKLYGDSYYNAYEAEVVEEFIRGFAKLFA